VSDEAAAIQNIDDIVNSLRRIQTEGGNGNFAVFILDQQKNYYVQFSGSPDNTQLYAEAVSNEFIAAEGQLPLDYATQLNRLGWISPEQGGSPNYSRTWTAENDAHRRSIADRVIETFMTVYGMQPGARLEFDLVLE
jgi:hypothetical protein